LIKQIHQRAHRGQASATEAKRRKNYSKIIKVKYILKHLIGSHGQKYRTDSLIGLEKVITNCFEQFLLTTKSGNYMAVTVVCSTHSGMRAY